MTCVWAHCPIDTDLDLGPLMYLSFYGMGDLTVSVSVATHGQVVRCAKYLQLLLNQLK